MKLKVDAEKRAHVLRSNFVRRNLSPEQKRELAKRQRKVANALRAEDPKKNTQKRVATLLGVARNTVSSWWNGHNVSDDDVSRPDARVKVPPKQRPVIAQRINAGENREQVAADFGITGRQAARIATVETSAANRAIERAASVSQPVGTEGLAVGDLRELGQSLADDSVDLIFTDPPYDSDSVPLYADLGKLAARVLRPGGWCLAYSGQLHLPQALNAMRPHLAYAWTFSMLCDGCGLRFRLWRLRVGWKPVVGFYKPPYKVWWQWFPDTVSGRREKTDHPWQQAACGAEHYIKALCPPGGLVLDPFCGSGTTLVAAKRLGVQAIGFDIDEEAVKTARARLAECDLEAA